MSDKLQIRKVGRPFMPEKERLDWKIVVRLTCDDRNMLYEIANAYEMNTSQIVRELIRNQHKMMKKNKQL